MDELGAETAPVICQEKGLLQTCDTGVSHESRSTALLPWIWWSRSSSHCICIRISMYWVSLEVPGDMGLRRMLDIVNPVDFLSCITSVRHVGICPSRLPVRGTCSARTSCYGPHDVITRQRTDKPTQRMLSRPNISCGLTANLGHSVDYRKKYLINRTIPQYDQICYQIAVQTLE